jgi:hypothetical protein
MSMNMTAFWDVALCTLMELDWCFRGAYCLHHQGDEVAVCTFETVYFHETAWCYVPQSCHPWVKVPYPSYVALLSNDKEKVYCHWHSDSQLPFFSNHPFFYLVSVCHWTPWWHPPRHLFGPPLVCHSLDVSIPNCFDFISKTEFCKSILSHFPLKNERVANEVTSLCAPR